MAECFLVQNGGGNSLNFKVVGNPQPASPKENTIWIDTDVDITSYAFSATEPEAPADGKNGPVWISVGTSSGVEFNALKKNAIQVYPASVKQYIDGEWKQISAHMYQGGEWVQFSFDRFYIFQEGQGIANGYEVKHLHNHSGFELGNDKITFATNTSVGEQIWINPKVNLGAYKLLCVELTCTARYGSSHTITIGVGSDVPTGQQLPGNFDASVPSIYDTTRKIYEVPISNVSGERYIKVAAFAITGYIHNIWLE